MGSREEATEERAPVGAEPSAPYELLRAVEVQLLERREPLRFEQALQLITLGAEHTPALVALAHRVRLA